MGYTPETNMMLHVNYINKFLIILKILMRHRQVINLPTVRLLVLVLEDQVQTQASNSKSEFLHVLLLLLLGSTFGPLYIRSVFRISPQPQS